MKFLQTLGLKSKNPDTRRETVENLARESDPGTLKALYPMLDDPEAIVRREAVKAIASFREGDTVPYLRKCFADPDRDVRLLAAGGLTKILVPAAVDALLAGMQDKDFAVRKRSAAALEARGWRPSTQQESILNALAVGRFSEVASEGEPAIELLAGVLQAEAASTRQEALEALGTIDSPNTFRYIASALKDSEPLVRLAAVNGLQRVRDARIFDPLLEALRDSDERVRNLAVTAVGNLGGARAVAPLLGMLKDLSMPVRLSTVEALAKIGDTRAVASLISCLQDRELDVRLAVIQTLGRLKDPQAVPSLTPMLENPEQAIRASVKFALQSINSNAAEAGLADLPESFVEGYDEMGGAASERIKMPRLAMEGVSLQMANDRTQTSEDLSLAGLQPLFLELQDPDPATRYRAAMQLGKIQNPRAIPALFQTLYDEGDAVRRAAAEVLEQLGWQPEDDSQAAWHAVVLRRWDTAVAIGPAALEAVAKALEIFDPSSQKAAALTLGLLGDSRAVDCLLETLNSKDFGIRKAAAEALGNLGDPRALPGLMEARGDGFKVVRDAAEEAIAKIGGG
jgi:HEAT repeat protein